MKTLRQSISTGGAAGTSGSSGTSWHDMGFKHNLAAATITSDVETLLQILLPPTADAADQPAAATPIVRLYGARLVFAADLAAQSTLTFGISVRRAGAQLGTANVFGWLPSTPAFSAWVSQALPDNHANNTALQQDGGAGPYYVPLLAGDVITLHQSSSGSVSFTAALLQLSLS